MAVHLNFEMRLGNFPDIGPEKCNDFIGVQLLALVNGGGGGGQALCLCHFRKNLQLCPAFL